MTDRPNRGLWLLFLIPVVLGLLSLLFGRFFISPREVWGSLVGIAEIPDVIRALVVRIRVPRIIAALCIGANLSVVGAAFQGMFRNPLVAPRILGVSSGAAFGAALALLLAGDPVSVQLSAFGFALVAVLLVCFVGWRFGSSILLLVVAGILVSSFFNALLGLIKYVADPLDSLPAITYWLLGGLSGTRWSNLPPLLIITGLGLTFFVLARWQLNVLTLDESEATTLGINVKIVRPAVIVIGTLLTAVSVSMCGIIGWIGLIVPHAARAIVGPDYSRLIPASIALGAFALLILDDISRTALPNEIPLGILTGIIGVPVFLLLLTKTIRTRQGWK